MTTRAHATFLTHCWLSMHLCYSVWLLTVRCSNDSIIYSIVAKF